MPEPGAREEETFSFLKAYTVQVTFTDAADAEQYTRLLIEDGTKVRRKGTSAIVYDLVLPLARAVYPQGAGLLAVALADRRGDRPRAG